MDKKTFRTALLFGCIGAAVTLIGDLLIGANPAAEASTGAELVDMFADAVGNSDLRMALGGMLGAVGIPVTGIGYYGISLLLRNERGVLPVLYKAALLAYIGLAGAGVHLACAAIPLLYKWIAATDARLAVEVAEKYACFFMLPVTALFGVLLLVALIYQSVIFAKGRTAYPKRAALYNMAVGVVAAYIAATLIGNNAVGNGIATGAISIGHLWMFGMLLLKLPEEYRG